MKSKIFPILFLLLVSITIVSAGLMPYAISGYIKYNGIPLSEISIIAKNIDEGKIINIETNKEGFFIATISDWGNNDNLEVIACNIAINPDCKQTKIIGTTCPSGGGCDFNFDLTNPETIIIKSGHTHKVTEIIYVCDDGTNVDDKTDCPVKPEVKPEEKPAVIEYVCWNGVKVANENLCSKKPEVIVKEYICEDGTKVENADQCPEGTSEWWYAIVGALIVAVASIFAVKYHWGKGFISLVTFWSKKDPKRAAKMLKTAIDKEKSGKYKE